MLGSNSDVAGYQAGRCPRAQPRKVFHLNKQVCGDDHAVDDSTTHLCHLKWLTPESFPVAYSSAGNG